MNRYHLLDLILNTLSETCTNSTDTYLVSNNDTNISKVSRKNITPNTTSNGLNMIKHRRRILDSWAARCFSWRSIRCSDSSESAISSLLRDDNFLLEYCKGNFYLFLFNNILLLVFSNNCKYNANYSSHCLWF